MASILLLVALSTSVLSAELPRGKESHAPNYQRQSAASAITPTVLRQPPGSAGQSQSTNSQPQDPTERMWAALSALNLSNWALVIAAIWAGSVALKTLKVQRIQIKLMRKATHASVTAAAAAENSAVAARDAADTASRDVAMTHRPRIMLRSMSIDGWGANRVTNTVRGTFRAVNVGPVDAEIRFVQWKWLCADELPMENPMHATVTPPDSPRGPIGSTAIMQIDTEATTISEDQRTAILRGELSLYWIGYIKYGRVGEPGLRRTYFGRRFNVTRGRFEVVDYPDYEYED